MICIFYNFYTKKLCRAIMVVQTNQMFTMNVQNIVNSDGRMVLNDQIMAI